MKNTSNVLTVTANTKTTTIHDPEAAKYFWNDYYSEAFSEEDDFFSIEHSFDMMGNPISKGSDKTSARKKGAGSNNK